ncbi:hypothetical protein MTO96_026472 [Rhipicephalus appendiculatus]
MWAPEVQALPHSHTEGMSKVLFCLLGRKAKPNLLKCFRQWPKEQKKRKLSEPRTPATPNIKASEKGTPARSAPSSHDAQPLKPPEHLAESRQEADKSHAELSGAGEASPLLIERGVTSPADEVSSMVKLSEIPEDDIAPEFPEFRQYTAMFQSPTLMTPTEAMSPVPPRQEGYPTEEQHKDEKHMDSAIAETLPIVVTPAEAKKPEEPGQETKVADAAPEESQAPRDHVAEQDQIYGYTSCCLTVLFLLAVVMLIVGLVHVVDMTWTTTATNTKTATNEESSSVVTAGPSFCSSELCNREADYIKSLMESSTTKPCENFYEHVCGSWSTVHPLGKNNGTGATISTDTIIQDHLVNTLLTLLPSNQEADVSLAVSLYHECADRSKESMATATVARLFGSWAIKQWPRDAAATTQDSWTFAGQIMRDLGLATFLEVINVAGPGEAPAVELSKPKHVFSCNDASRIAVTMQFRDALSDIASVFTQSPNAALIDEIMAVFIRVGSSPREPSVAELEELKFGGYVVVKLSETDPAITDFLRVTFDNASMFDPTTTVKLKSSRYVRNYLPAALRELPARAIMNYAAFLVLIRLAPFFPEKHLGLRQLFFKDLRGRTFADAVDSRVLCLMAVETVLPSCLAKVSTSQTKDERERISNRLAYLENAFSRRISNLAWISEYEALVQRYQLKRRRLAYFGHGNESCVDASSAAGYPTGNPVEFYQAVARSQQRAKLRAQSASGLPAALLSPLRTQASYDASRRRVPVPVALFNASVPSRGTLFTLHLSRYAVRFYHALVEKLFNAVYHSDSLSSSDDLQRRLELLLNCFEEDLGQLPDSLQRPKPPPRPSADQGRTA